MAAAANVKAKYRRHPLVTVVEVRYIVNGDDANDPLFTPTAVYIRDKAMALDACMLCNAHSRALVYEFMQLVSGDAALYCVREYRENRKGRRFLGYVNIPATLLAFQILAKETSHIM